MVRIRLKRMGRRNRPFYRINAIEKRKARDGKIIESLGWYDPLVKDWDKAVELNDDRVRHWLSVGAQPSETVKDILARRGVIDAEQRRLEVEARAERKRKGRAAAAAAAAGGDKSS